MEIVDIKSELRRAAVLDVLAHSAYMPTPEKMAASAEAYMSDESVCAFACVDGQAVAGAMVIKRTAPGCYEIARIATAPEYRKTGVGRALIAFAAERFRGRICAETDDDAVDFYRKCGFKIESLGEKYQGIVRYMCTLEPQ